MMEGNQLATSVHRKTTNKGLLRHYKSHADNKYKHSLLKTMLIRAHLVFHLPHIFFSVECNNLKSMFLKLKYPLRLQKLFEPVIHLLTVTILIDL